MRRGRWLDAGCGDGKGLVPLLTHLDREAAPVVALDSARSALAHARHAVQEIHGTGGLARVRFVQGDAMRPSLSGGFDAVRAVHLIGHLRAPGRRRACAALFGLLGPGGVLVVSEFGTNDFRCAKGSEVEPGTRRRGTGIETHYFTREELLGLVEQGGATVLSLQAERFHVTYGGQRLARERWDLVAQRDGP